MKNNNLYNDKELNDDADLNWYDYGFRSYDPQIGRFPQLDPLTDDYPELTPYQYGSNDPIANIDVDGLEGLSSIGRATNAAAGFGTAVKGFGRGLSIASVGINAGRLALIVARGTSDALYNANTIGLYDAFGGNHLNSYDDPYEQQAYLKGRLGGDAIATAQSAAEINVGGGVALSTGIETVGVGAAAGGALALHGAGMGATAAADAGWSLKKLYQLNISTTAASDVGSTPKKYESPTNVSKQTQTNSTTLWKGKGKERIDVENPNPSQREGQIHYQDNKGGKFLYDIKTNTFRGVSKSVNKMLNSSVIKNAIKKGLKYLGH